MSILIGTMRFPAALVIFSWCSGSEITKVATRKNCYRGMRATLKIHWPLQKDTSTYVHLH
jgi:hypothetical protein